MRLDEHNALIAVEHGGMTGGYAKSVRRHAPQAVICIDNYHVVQLATKALDEVRREHWNELRKGGDPTPPSSSKTAAGRC